jgi:hypothetical protein
MSTSPDNVANNWMSAMPGGRRPAGRPVIFGERRLEPAGIHLAPFVPAGFLPDHCLTKHND